MGKTRDDQLKEMEKRVEMLKNVVERVERENIQLQQSPAVVSHQTLKSVQTENNQLKVCFSFHFYFVHSVNFFKSLYQFKDIMLFLTTSYFNFTVLIL